MLRPWHRHGQSWLNEHFQCDSRRLQLQMTAGKKRVENSVISWKSHNAISLWTCNRISRHDLHKMRRCFLLERWAQLKIMRPVSSRQTQLEVTRADVPEAHSFFSDRCVGTGVRVGVTGIGLATKGEWLKLTKPFWIQLLNTEVGSPVAPKALKWPHEQCPLATCTLPHSAGHC
jgi:hypothetical protein